MKSFIFFPYWFSPHMFLSPSLSHDHSLNFSPSEYFVFSFLPMKKNKGTCFKIFTTFRKFHLKKRVHAFKEKGIPVFETIQSQIFLCFEINWVSILLVVIGYIGCLKVLSFYAIGFVGFKYSMRRGRFCRWKGFDIA